MTVTNPYYEFAPSLVPGTKARATEVNTQYQLIQNAFDLMPDDPDAITTGTTTLAPETGSGNAYVVTMPNTRTSNQDGDEVMFFATHTNGGATTLNVDGLGAVSMVDRQGAAIGSGGITDGLFYAANYDASNTRFVLDVALNTIVNIIDTVQGTGVDDPTAPGTFDANLGYENVNGDALANTGFNASIDFKIFNEVWGGNVLVAGRSLAGTEIPIATFNPETRQLILSTSNDAATPTLAFGDGNTGFYEESDNVLLLSQAGAARWRFTLNGISAEAAAAGGILKNGTATGTAPTYSPNKADLDTGIGSNAADQLSLIAGAKEMLRLVETGTATSDQVIIGPAGIIGTVATPGLAFGNGDSGFYEVIDDRIRVSLAATDSWEFRAEAFRGVAGPAIMQETASATNPVFVPLFSDDNTGVGSGGADDLTLIAGGVDCINIAASGGARQVGFYTTAAISLQTGVAVTAGGVHAALVALGLITA